MCNQLVADEENPMLEEIVEVTRTAELDAPIGEVWHALTDSGELSRWLADDVELDVRPGGVGRIRLPDGDKSVLVTAVEEERRLSLLWWGEDGETSSVEMTLAPQPANTRGSTVTLFRVVERRGAPAGPVAMASAQMWNGAVSRLGAVWCRV
jgi:uncharacterized protein YndB with AHSA1/START domain